MFLLLFKLCKDGCRYLESGNNISIYIYGNNKDHIT